MECLPGRGELCAKASAMFFDVFNYTVPQFLVGVILVEMRFFCSKQSDIKYLTLSKILH